LLPLVDITAGSVIAFRETETQLLGCKRWLNGLLTEQHFDFGTRRECEIQKTWGLRVLKMPKAC
jgi:hypothetical protein